MDQAQINQILEDHQAWLNDETTGKRAYLGGAYLQGADLYRADLQRTDLRRVVE